MREISNFGRGSLVKSLESWWWILDDTRIVFYDDRISIFWIIWVCTPCWSSVVYTEVVPVIFDSIIIATEDWVIAEIRTDSSVIFRASAYSIESSDSSLDIELIAWNIEKYRFLRDIIWGEWSRDEFWSWYDWSLRKKYRFYNLHWSIDIDISSFTFFIFKSDDRSRSSDSIWHIDIDIYISPYDDQAPRKIEVKSIFYIWIFQEYWSWIIFRSKYHHLIKWLSS